MSPTPVSPRPIWPEFWAAALRDRLNFLRLLTLLFALLTLFGVTAAFGFNDESGLSPWLVGSCIVGVTMLWVWGYQRDGVPLRLVPLELTLLLALFVGIKGVFGPFGAMFLALQHRALYGRRGDATIVACGYGAVVVAGYALRPPSTSLLAVVTLELAVGAFGAYLMHTVGEVLVRDQERKERLRRSEERYRAMFQNNPWPMWLYEPGTLRIVEVNESAVRHYGYSREEFLARTIYDIRPESERETITAILASVADGRRATHLVRHMKKSGEIIDVEVTGHSIELEGRALRLAVGVDVTSRERAERALRESESRFRSVANCLREALLITDVDDRIVLANDRVREVLGYEPAAIVGREATALLLPASQRNAFRDRVRHRLQGESELYEIELVRADGAVIVAEVSASPYRDMNGQIVGTLGAISDVTDRKRLEERVRQSSRLEAVGQLAGGVAHDFNNLLTVIKCHTELLRDELSPVAPLQASVREIERAADRAAEVTGQLLAFGRKQLMQPRPLVLERVVEEALPVLRKLAGARIQITVRSQGDGAPVFADPTQVENALVTLVRNATDAMPEGGDIRIETCVADLEAHDLHLQHQHLPAGRYAVLAVKDAGEGMSPDVQRRLFEPFFTTKEVGAGSGLGLASMFGIVRQSGGFVDVRSAVGAGTTFLIYFPVHAAWTPGASGELQERPVTARAV